MKDNIKSFLRSFTYAAAGVRECVKNERNFRFHIAAAVFVTAFSLFYELTKVEYILLALTFSSVISAELINTAVEAAVDLCSPEYHKLAKLAKDTAAGAVLVTAIFAVVVGILLFGEISVIKEIFRYYCSHISALAGLICSLAAAWAFVFVPPNKKRSK